MITRRQFVMRGGLLVPAAGLLASNVRAASYLPNRRKAFRSSNTPPVTSGMIFFCEAGQEAYSNDGTVGTITDLSGNGFNATQATEANKPVFKTGIINGRSVYRFGGIDDYCAFSGGGLGMLNSLSGWTVFAVAKTTTVAAGVRTIFGASVNGTTSLVRYTLTVNNTAGKARAVYRMLNGGGFSEINTATALVAEQFYVLGSKNNPGTSNMSLWLDDAASADVSLTPTVGTSVQASSSTGSNIGCGNNAASAFWSGDLAALLIYNTELDTTNFDSVRYWLVSRYGL